MSAKTRHTVPKSVECHKRWRAGVFTAVGEIAEQVTADEAIALQLYPSLRRFAAIVASPEMAPDDLVHDALVAALRCGPLSRLDMPGPYLRRAMINLASNHRRRLSRAHAAFRRLAAGSDSAANDHYPSDLAHLAVLDPTSRAVLYLHEVEGLSFEDIAVQLELSPANARQRAARSRRRLRSHLEEES